MSKQKIVTLKLNFKSIQFLESLPKKEINSMLEINSEIVAKKCLLIAHERNKMPKKECEKGRKNYLALPTTTSFFYLSFDRNYMIICMVYNKPFPAFSPTPSSPFEQLTRIFCGIKDEILFQQCLLT